MRRFPVTLIAAAALLATMACADSTTLEVRPGPDRADRTVDPDGAFEIRVGEMVLVEGTHVLIFFDRVLEDSRCPTGVECPWEGNASSRFELSLDNAELAPQEAVLNTALEPHEIGMFGLRIRLAGLRPHPVYADPPIDPAEYVAELVVERP